MPLPLPRSRRINFSIPGSKLRTRPLEKDQLFARHVQCEEAYELDPIRRHCRKSYLFEKEEDYYQDLARSRYAITMKKMGWECQRHYEIAANHTVPCFYRLSRKPRRCAPHGLVDGENVLAFDSAGELQEKIEEVRRNGEYAQASARGIPVGLPEHLPPGGGEVVARVGSGRLSGTMRSWQYGREWRFFYFWPPLGSSPSPASTGIS